MMVHLLKDNSTTSSKCLFPLVHSVAPGGGVMDLLGEDFSGLQVKSICAHCLNKNVHSYFYSSMRKKEEYFVDGFVAYSKSQTFLS